MLTRRLRRSLLLLLSIALFAVACGGSDAATTDAADAADGVEFVAAEADVADPTAAPEPTDVPAPTAAPEPTAVPEPEPADEAEPTAEPEPVEDAAAQFYDAPGDLQFPLPLPAGEPGSIIDTEELSVDGAVGHRLLYHSTSTSGEDIGVSGFVLMPDGEPPEDGWPLIAWAHGTTGLGDTCAPSINAETDQLAAALISFGYAVVATDFEGLGTPGVHPYVVGVSEGHSVLDSVRAVHALDLPVTDRWIAFGHSQGGHAAMFTAQLHPTYAPELELIGTVAGAPPSQMGNLGDSLVGGDFQGYLVMTTAGLAAAYDDIALEDILTPSAIELIDVVETGCTSEIFDVYNVLDYADIAKIDDPSLLPGWGPAIVAQDTNQLPVLHPLLIIHGGEDEQIPVETSAMLFDQLCAFPDQGPTERIVYPGQSHAGILTNFTAVPDLLSFFQGRFNGDPFTDTCV